MFFKPNHQYINMNYVLVLLLIVGNFAASELEQRLSNVLCEMINVIKNIMPMVLVVAIVLSALVYGIAQILPQELKARTSSWALSGIIFTILAAIIFLVAPLLLQMIVPEWNITNIC